jgi:hypothetical protein
MNIKENNRYVVLISVYQCKYTLNSPIYLSCHKWNPAILCFKCYNYNIWKVKNDILNL